MLLVIDKRLTCLAVGRSEASVIEMVRSQGGIVGYTVEKAEARLILLASCSLVAVRRLKEP